MINRAVLILKYKAPAIKWVNDADTYDDDPGITEENINGRGLKLSSLSLIYYHFYP